MPAVLHIKQYYLPQRAGVTKPDLKSDQKCLIKWAQGRPKGVGSCGRRVVHSPCGVCWGSHAEPTRNGRVCQKHHKKTSYIDFFWVSQHMLVPEAGDLVVQDGKSRVEQCVWQCHPWVVRVFFKQEHAWQWRCVDCIWKSHTAAAKSQSLQLNKGVMLFSLGY